MCARRSMDGCPPGSGEVLIILSCSPCSRSYGSYPTAILTPPQFSSSLPPSSLPEGTTQQMMDLSNIAHPTLLKILREVIDLDDCIAYSYNPSADCDPHA